MIGVSKTFGGSSILSSPAREKPQSLDFTGLSGFFYMMIDEKKKVTDRKKTGISVALKGNGIYPNGTASERKKR